MGLNCTSQRRAFRSGATVVVSGRLVYVDSDSGGGISGDALTMVDLKLHDLKWWETCEWVGEDGGWKGRQ